MKLHEISDEILQGSGHSEKSSDLPPSEVMRAFRKLMLKFDDVIPSKNGWKVKKDFPVNRYQLGDGTNQVTMTINRPYHDSWVAAIDIEIERELLPEVKNIHQEIEEVANIYFPTLTAPNFRQQVRGRVVPIISFSCDIKLP
jgi:hypothetical protein